MPMTPVRTTQSTPASQPRAAATPKKKASSKAASVAKVKGKTRELTDMDEFVEAGTEVARSVSEYAAQKPVTALAIAAAAGFVLGKILR